MNRVALREPIQKTTRSSALAYFDRGAQVEIVQRGTTTRVNVYSAEEGGSVLQQPLVTDLRGIPVEPETELTAWAAPDSCDYLVGAPPAEGEEDTRERFPMEIVSGTIGADLESLLGDADALVFKGVKDCSANPNYPAASAGYLYKVSVAGKIGGAAGLSVEVGDSLLCLVDGSAAGTQAAVGANWAVLQANVGIDTDSTFAANSDGLVPSQKAVKAALDKVTLGTDWGSGSRVDFFAAGIAGQRLEIKAGSGPIPLTGSGPLIKASRTGAVTKATIEALGGVGTDGSDQLAAIMGISRGTKDEEVQGVGIAGFAYTESEKGNPGNDAEGGHFQGWAKAGSVGSAGIGLTAVGRSDAVGGELTAIEVAAYNATGSDGTLAEKGASSTKAIWGSARGTNDSAVFVQLGNVTGRQFLYMLHANGQENGGKVGGVKNAMLRDDSHGLKSIWVRGEHTEGAIIVEQGAGSVVFGRASLATANAMLEVANDLVGRDPLAVFGSTTAAQKYTVMVRNSVGSMRMLVSNGTEPFFTGEAAGDTGIEFTAGKSFRIGAVGKTHKITVTEGGLSFFGVAPAAQQAAISEPDETLASLKACCNALRSVVKTFGYTA
jgi:hypothetical protein